MPRSTGARRPWLARACRGPDTRGCGCDSRPAGGRVLTLIVAIPGLQRGLTANALPANVTLTVEGSGRFFNTPNLEACFVDITQHEPRDAGTHAVGGLLYCVLPLGEINGDGAVTIQDMVFSGTADWGTS